MWGEVKLEEASGAMMGTRNGYPDFGKGKCERTPRSGDRKGEGDIQDLGGEKQRNINDRSWELGGDIVA